MKRLCSIERSRIFSPILRISLVGLICLLGVFDAPEYTRCTHVGVCEFLEISGDITETRKLENLLEAMNKCLHRVSSAKGHLGRLLAGFFPWLKKTIRGNFIQNFVCPVILPILYRCISPTYKILFSPLKPDGMAPVEEKQNLPSESNLPSLTLQIINTSIIKS